jgi:hypothetical protein
MDDPTDSAEEKRDRRLKQSREIERQTRFAPELSSGQGE